MSQNVANLLHLAVERLHYGNPDEAERLLQKVLKKHPRNFDALHLSGIIRGMRNDTAGAITLFKKAVAADPDNSFAHFNLAKALSESGKDGEALSHHRKTTALDPGRHESWLNYGATLHNLRRPLEALDCYDKAIKINPAAASAWSNRGVALNSLHRHDEALVTFQKALELDPTLAETLYNMGMALGRLGRHEEALDAIRPGALHQSPPCRFMDQSRSNTGASGAL